MRLFHYTISRNLLKIIEDKTIKTSGMFLPKDEKPVVWATFARDFEPTSLPAMDGKLLSFQELCSVETPCRIEIPVDCAPLKWSAWKKQSGVKSRMAKALEESAFRKGSKIEDWRMSLEPISQAKWLAIECYRDGKWRVMCRK